MLTIKQIADAAKIIAREFSVTEISLFGSYAENRNTEDSDVDILIKFSPDARVTLLTICTVKYRMEELLDTPVDVVSLPIPQNSILEINKVVPLYAA